MANRCAPSSTFGASLADGSTRIRHAVQTIVIERERERLARIRAFSIWPSRQSLRDAEGADLSRCGNLSGVLMCLPIRLNQCVASQTLSMVSAVHCASRSLDRHTTRAPVGEPSLSADISKLTRTQIWSSQAAVISLNATSRTGTVC